MGIGWGITTLIFGSLTALCIYVYYLVQNIEVENIGELFVAFFVILLGAGGAIIIGVITGSLTMLGLIMTIVRIVKYSKSTKVVTAGSAQTEPKF